MNQARRNGSSLTYNMVRPSLCPSRLLYRGCVNVRVWKGWCLILGPPRSCPSLLGRFPHEQQVGLCERGDDVELLGVRLERQLADGDVLWVRGQQHVQRRRRVQVEVDVLWLIDLPVDPCVAGMVVQHRQLPLNRQPRHRARPHPHARVEVGLAVRQPARVVRRRQGWHPLVHPVLHRELVGHSVHRKRSQHLREQRVCLLRKLGPPWVCRVRVHGSHVAEVLAGQSAAEGHV
mmetsp:Transcript_3814/g.11808  ORF Transcript_3814/g.11808 Transcript_3814/m.11808 type:complete len:233 (-) Transcript_3814:546-1244(-)